MKDERIQQRLDNEARIDEGPAQPIAEAAAIWIDTDGQFYVSNHATYRAAEDAADILGESGIPVVVMRRETLIALVTVMG